MNSRFISIFIPYIEPDTTGHQGELHARMTAKAYTLAWGVQRQVLLMKETRERCLKEKIKTNNSSTNVSSDQIKSLIFPVYLKY